jgi:hypothetical protein
MTRARDVSRLITTPPSIYATDSESSAAYIPLSSPVNGFKNKIINGSMKFWQRSTSFTTPAGVYTADRYRVTQNATSGTYVVSRQTASLEGFQYCMRIQRSNSQTATGGIFLGHSLESADVIPLQSKPMVFSFYARKGSNFSSASSDIGIQLATGTGTDGQPFAGLTNEVTQINTNSVLTTSWQRFSYTFTIPSNASELRFNMFYAPVGTAGANDYWEITGIQLEVGTIVTDFEHKQHGIEEQMCFRYFHKNDIRLLKAASSYSAESYPFPVPMRISPNISYTDRNSNANRITTYAFNDSATHNNSNFFGISANSYFLSTTPNNNGTGASDISWGIIFEASAEL